MPLSEEEQRLLEQMEQALAAEDPKFASTLRGSGLVARNRRVLLSAAAGFIAGVALLLGGAVASLVPVMVAGFVVMLVAAYVGLSRSSSAPAQRDDLPSNVHALPDKRQRRQRGRQRSQASPFMTRMEERWRRRRDGGY